MKKEGTVAYGNNAQVTVAVNQRLTMEENFKKFQFSDDCPVRHVLDRFGDKWSILIISVLGETDKMRFNELHKRIGDISQKMLTVTLRTLEADGLVTRTIYPEVPPRVEYNITERGRTLLPLIIELADWATNNFDAILKSRKSFLERAVS